MPLFWLVHEIDGERIVRIEESHAMIFAALNEKIDGFHRGASARCGYRRQGAAQDDRAHAHAR
jgi:hypothetical protein